MTSHLATCSTCQRRCAVVVVSSVKVAGRWVQWQLCVSCELRERKEADERAIASIEQAERAGV